MTGWLATRCILVCKAVIPYLYTLKAKNLRFFSHLGLKINRTDESFAINNGGGVATTLLSHVYISIWVEGIWKKYTIYLSIATNLATYFQILTKCSDSYLLRVVKKLSPLLCVNLKKCILNYPSEPRLWKRVNMEPF